MSNFDPITIAAMCREFDRTLDTAHVAQVFGCDERQVFTAVLAATRRMVTPPRDPAPARRLFLVPSRQVA